MASKKNQQAEQVSATEAKKLTIGDKIVINSKGGSGIIASIFANETTGDLLFTLHDGQTKAHKPTDMVKVLQRPASLPEQPKRTRRNVEDVEREAYQRGIQAGIERAARQARIRAELDKNLSELERAVADQGMSLAGALSRAAAAGIGYQNDIAALDQA